MLRRRTKMRQRVRQAYFDGGGREELWEELHSRDPEDAGGEVTPPAAPLYREGTHSRTADDRAATN
jgi:hypothetical protein